MSEDAITVTGVHKIFKLPHEKRNTLFESLTGALKGKKGYEDYVALKDINFTVKRGEAVGIIGENGSGKSTLLKIIANILRPSSGSVRINGKITPFLELGVGFQSDLTAKENIYIYGAIMGLSDQEIDAKLGEILEFSGLTQFQDAKLKNLSSGMQVRLAFATAIQTDPDILLMDEVLAVGDMEFQQKCMDVFHQYIKENKTIVLVSHDLSSVRRFCSTALLLRRGEQVAFGKTNEIIDKYVYGVGEKSENKESDLKDSLKKKRWGNKIVEITDVRFIDKFEKENATFTFGDPMKIRIVFNAKKTIEDLVFGLIIYNENGIYCYGTNTELKKYPINNVLGKNEIDFVIDRIPMYQGKYYLTIAAHSISGEPFDWHDKLHSFNVFNPTEDLGLFEVPCRWELRQNNENFK
ncbi:MAG TPA: ABC transporter ATP-binding protein [Candidatus Methanoperedens sp.]